ncbi:hypothetical protein CK203_022701 [Vitis vinifera]|uniref:Uncharacterized protein n=1 Tax=Vitis vinifera TaxID=29760 RepID=A0A438JEC3_VITVI|nr:hypothetical protein CK203_022701 [Vitis vinifera]
MIVRAFKHILQAIIVVVVNPEKLAMSIAAALNLMLGVPGNRELNQSCNAHPLVWRWLEALAKLVSVCGPLPLNDSKSLQPSCCSFVSYGGLQSGPLRVHFVLVFMESSLL